MITVEIKDYDEDIYGEWQKRSFEGNWLVNDMKSKQGPLNPLFKWSIGITKDNRIAVYIRKDDKYACLNFFDNLDEAERICTIPSDIMKRTIKAMRKKEERKKFFQKLKEKEKLRREQLYKELPELLISLNAQFYLNINEPWQNEIVVNSYEQAYKINKFLETFSDLWDSGEISRIIEIKVANNQ